MFDELERRIATAHQQIARAIATAQAELGYPAEIIEGSSALIEGSQSILVRSLEPNSLLIHEGYTRVTGEVVLPNRYAEGAIAAVDASAILGATIEGTQ